MEANQCPTLDSKPDSDVKAIVTHDVAENDVAKSDTSGGTSALPTPVQVVKPTLRGHADSLLAESSYLAENQNPSTDHLVTSSNLATNKDKSEMKFLPHNESNANYIHNNNNSKNPSGNIHCENDIKDRFEEEAEFDWNEYLDVSGAIAASPTSFLHVENSLQNLYTEGMKLEVPNRHCPGSYWIASIVMTCGPLLRLRYEGLEGDRSADFWCDITTGELHPLGWSTENGRQLEPSLEIKQKIRNWTDFLEKCVSGAHTVPSYLLNASGCTAVDQIKQGTRLEIQEHLVPNHVWIVTVLENVGGRLLLRYDGVYTSAFDFWLFYLSHRAHPIGWAKENDCLYEPPSAIVSSCGSVDWDKILSKSLDDALKLLVPPVIFKCQESIELHDFLEGMKLEAIDPAFSMDICPATVTKVLSPYYFLVDIDPPFRCETVPSEPKSFCCHAHSQNIFPVGWARSNGIKIPRPRGAADNIKEFDWDEYLNQCFEENNSVKRAPEYLFNLGNEDHGIEVGMKFEAVNPFQPHQICAATAIRVIKHLLWIQLDNLHGVHPNHIVPVSSHEIFPIGWCESNRYPLKVPLVCRQSMKRSLKKVAIVIPKKHKRKFDGNDDEAVDFMKDTCERPGPTASGKAWCPEIYVNHRCFSGPFLSKSRLAGLPRRVGPGPVTLVLSEVISRLVNVSYLPSRVLGLLQNDGEPKPGMQQQLIKAKYKFKTHRAMVNILRSSDRVSEFCRDICRRLECCPNLIGPESVGDSCSENCYMRTKSNKTLIKRGRRRRKHHRSLAYKKSLALKAAAVASASSSKDENGVENVKEENGEDRTQASDVTAATDVVAVSKIDEKLREKRKYVHRVLPKSDIVTRGAKLPNFALELRRKRRKSGLCFGGAATTTTTARSTPDRSSTSTAVSTAAVSSSSTSMSSCSSTSSSSSSSLSSSATSSSSTMTTTARREDEVFVQPEKKPKLAKQKEFSPIVQVKTEIAVDSSMDSSAKRKLSHVDTLRLDTNPLLWTVDEVADFMKGTDCLQVARDFKDQEIDGQALLLLTLPTIQEHLQLKLGPAIKLCHHIERVKMAFYTQFDC